MPLRVTLEQTESIFFLKVGQELEQLKVKRTLLGCKDILFFSAVQPLLTFVGESMTSFDFFVLL
jgi:hypothetical protein